MQPEKLAVHHEGEHGQGNPQAAMQGGESPGEPLESKAISDRGIISDVYLIIVIDKLVVPQIAIGCQRGRDQEEAGYDDPATM